MDKIVSVNNIDYTIIKLLGHGKGGYSYLASSEGKQVVLKQIHHDMSLVITMRLATRLKQK